MMMNRKLILMVFVLVLSTLTAWARMDKVSLPLADAIRSSATDTKHSMLVYLTDQVDIRALDERLFYQGVTRQYRHEVVVTELQRTAERSQGPVRMVLDDLVASGNVEGYRSFWIVNAFVVYGDAQALEALSDRSDVDYVEMNFTPEGIQPIIDPSREHLDSDANTPPIGIRIINAPRVWYELGVTGAGALVANCDTGVDGTHPALAGRWRGTIAPAAQCWRAPVSGSTNPTDNDQHGTHVMGTICGATNGGTGDTTGVAPGALWIGDDAIGGGTGTVFDNNVIDAYQWMADPDGNPGTVDDVPDVCQNSWGVDGRFAGYTDCDNRWNAAIQGLEAASCVVTFSAGNEGPGASTHRSPANVAIDSVTFFAIGAVDASTTDTIPPLPIASFSSRGPSDCNGQIKPEVAAPGVSVYSSIPGGGYSSAFSGTSMAGPHVAGIVGLMRSANPDVDVRTIKSILMRTARDQDAAGNDNTSGFGLVDAYQAVLQVMGGFGRIKGTILDANTLLPIQAQVAVVGGTQSTTASVSGGYTLLVPGDSTYTVRYSLYGYVSQDIVLTVATDDTVTQNVNLVPRPILYLLNEDFETGAPGWTHSSQAGWVDQWHISTERSRSTTHSYKCGDTGTGTYANHQDAYLISPTLTALPAEAQLSFWYQVEAETSNAYVDSAYDGGLLEISANGGAFTQVVPTPAYNKRFRLRTSGGRPYNGPLPGARCYTGQLATWTNVTFDLAAYEGQDVQLRYRFCADSTTGREGWYVDDVLVTALGTPNLDPVTELVVQVSGTDIVLSWLSTGAPLYNIYSDPVADGSFTTLVAQTAATTYTIVNGYAAADKLFYIVKATDGAVMGPRSAGGAAIR